MRATKRRAFALLLFAMAGSAPSLVRAADITGRKSAATTDVKAEMATRETNKRTVLAFYDATVNLDFETARRYVGDYYIEHDPDREDGLPGLRNALEFNRRSGIRQDVVHQIVVADRDLVAIYSTATTRMAGAPPGPFSQPPAPNGAPAGAGASPGVGAAPADRPSRAAPKPNLVGDIFRLRDGKIVEHWNAIYSK